MIHKFKKLIEVIKNSNFDYDYKNADLTIIEDQMSQFADYVDIVYRETILLPIFRAKYEGEELRDAITEMDKKRRNCHESAIAACSQLNRLCEIYDVPTFCPDTKDRYEIANFCAQITMAFYLEGLNKDAKDIDAVISAIKETNVTINPHLKLDELERNATKAIEISDDDMCL